MAMTTEQPKRAKTKKESIATAQAAIAICEQKKARGEQLTDEEITFYEQSIKLLQSKGIIEKPSYKVHLTNASTIKPKHIQWIWPNFLACGKLCLLAGMPSDGKTTLCMLIAAIITKGDVFPTGEKCLNKGRVLIWSGEDDPEDTLIPRLIAANADMTKVDFIKGRFNERGELEPFDPAIDFQYLNAIADELKDVKLIIIDPIVSTIQGDMNQNNNVRRSLQPLVDIAIKLNCAIIGINHFTKGTSGKNPIERFNGSIGMIAAARQGLVTAKVQDTNERLLAIAKNNIGRDNIAIKYSIEQVTITGNITASRAIWGEVINETARTLLDELENPEGDERENNEPAEVLAMILADGKMDSKDVKKIMLNNGFSEKKTRTARQKLGIQITKEGRRNELKTFWELPNKCPNNLYMPIYKYGHLLEKGHLLNENEQNLAVAKNDNRDTKSKNKDTEKVKNDAEITPKKLTKNELTKKQEVSLLMLVNPLHLKTSSDIFKIDIINTENYQTILNTNFHKAMELILNDSNSRDKLNKYYADNGINLKATDDGQLVATDTPQNPIVLADDEEAL